MRIYLTIFLSLLLVPFIGLAATNDFVADGNITVSGVTFGLSTADMIIFSGSTAESWTFNSGAFTVTTPGSAFQVGSSDSSVKSMKILNSAGSVLVCAENTTPGTSYATLPTSSATYTVEPSSTTDCTTLCTTLSNTATYNSYPTCGAATCNSGYRISGSGSSATCVMIGGGGIIITGAGGMSAPVIPPQVPAVIAQAPTAPKAVEVSPVFTSVLKFGMMGADVKRLQQLLNSDSDTKVAESGAGSPGNETEYFGTLTIVAVRKFQAKYNIVSSGDEDTTGYGLLGPKTRAKLTEVFTKATPTASSVAQPSLVAAAVSPVFSRGLDLGTAGEDVKRLQQLLNSDSDTKIAESGAGSPGNETEYYGNLTMKAVQKFQVKYGIAKEGDPGYGYVGPKTRAKFQEVFK